MQSFIQMYSYKLEKNNNNKPIITEQKLQANISKDGKVHNGKYTKKTTGEKKKTKRVTKDNLKNLLKF